MKIDENVAILTLPSPVPGSNAEVSLTLTWDEQNLVLVDAGFPDQVDLIKQAIVDEGFLAENLTHLIITHQDLDHIGSMKDLQKIAPNMQIMTSVDEASYLDGRSVPVKLAKALAEYDNLPVEHKQQVDHGKQVFEQLQLKFDKELQNGELLPICGGMEVIGTPGHTPGHISLFLHKSRMLICGDAAKVEDGQLHPPSPMHTYDVDLSLQSLEKIKQIPKTGWVAYHGGYLSAGETLSE